MWFTPDSDALAYEAPGHHGMRMRRIQGKEVSPLPDLWSACLDLEPGGHVEPKGSPAGKLYLLTQGEVWFRGGAQEVVMHPGDSVFVPPNEEREFKEAAGQKARLYLVMLERFPPL